MYTHTEVCHETCLQVVILHVFTEVFVGQHLFIRLYLAATRTSFKLYFKSNVEKLEKQKNTAPRQNCGQPSAELLILSFWEFFCVLAPRILFLKTVNTLHAPKMDVHTPSVANAFFGLERLKIIAYE